MAKCNGKPKGGIKSILISPWSQDSDAKIIRDTDIFFQIGDAIAEEGETIVFGNDIVYTKIKQDGKENRP